MKTKLMSKLFALGAVLALGVGWGPVAAANTPAGTEIVNDATLNYDVSGVSQTPITASSQDNDSRFVVDRRLNVTVARVDSAAVQVAPGATGRELTFDVTNLSNDTIDLLLGLSRNADFDVFSLGGDVMGVTSTVTEVCIDTSDPLDGDCNATLSEEGDHYRLPGVEADETIRVIVKFTIPSSVVDQEWESWSLAAAVTDPDATGIPFAAHDSNGRDAFGQTGAPAAEADDPDNVQNVFADAEVIDGSYGYNFGTDQPTTASPGENDGQFAATSQFLVASAKMTIEKFSRVVWDPINGSGCTLESNLGAENDPYFSGIGTSGACTNPNPRRLPGAIIEYRILVTNDGSANADAISVSDTQLANNVSVVDEDHAGTHAEFTHVYARQCGDDAVVGSYARAVNDDDPAVELTVAGGFSNAQLGTCEPGDSGDVVYYVVID